MIRSFIFIYCLIECVATSSGNAQNVILSDAEGGVIESSTNGKDGWKSCSIGKELIGFVKIPKNTKVILSSKSIKKSVLWKKDGIYKLSELEAYLSGYDNDAAKTLWYYVNEHHSSHSRVNAGVHRGDEHMFLLADSSRVCEGDSLVFDLNNENESPIRFNLMCFKQGGEYVILDTAVNTRSTDLIYYFNQPCNCKWGISNWESPEPQNWRHLFIVDKAEYEREYMDFLAFSATIMSLESEIRDYLIDLYCLDKKLPLLKDKAEN